MGGRTEDEEHDIVIVGGGIAGLATALALHRKGIKSLVLERSETLRATTGAAIEILANGWRALDQLGLGSHLRQTAIPILGVRWVSLGKKETSREIPRGKGEARCLKRSELLKALADALPPGTIRFGCNVVSIKLDSLTSIPVIQFLDGKSMVAKVLIGCDGAKSVVAEFLELKPTRVAPISSARGLTNYPNGQPFSHEHVRVSGKNAVVGTIPVDDNSVYWFVGRQLSTSKEAKGMVYDPELIIQSTLQSMDDFPTELREMVEGTDRDTVALTRLRYRAPWDLLFGKFRKGTVTVAGDAMHVMGPFLGQGGSAALEDAIVLARCLSKKFGSGKQLTMVKEVGEAIDQYVKERRMRVLRLSTQSYLLSLVAPNSPLLVKLASIFVMVIFLLILSSDHTRYDCGIL